MKRIWHQRFDIRSYEADSTGKARVSTLCNLLQEAASKHSNHLGFGYHDIVSAGAIWMLSRLVLHVSERPGFGDSVVVRTWPKGTRGPFAVRDFTIDRDEHAKTTPVACATTVWVVVDLETGRPRRPDSILPAEHLTPDVHAINRSLEKLPPHDSWETSHDIHVRSSDMDILEHVNNVRYIEWIEDLVAEIGVADPIREIEINFLSDARYNDALVCSISSSSENDDSHVRRASIRHVGEGREAVRALLTWQPSDETVSPAAVEGAEKTEQREIDETTIENAESLAAVRFDESERLQILEVLPAWVERYRDRRKIELPNELAPDDPTITGRSSHAFSNAENAGGEQKPDSAESIDAVTTHRADTGPTDVSPPADDEDIAFASVMQLRAWLDSGRLSSLELTRLCLDRLETYASTLSCLSALTEERALSRARAADEMQQKGRIDCLLHGIPWGAKDLFDTAGIRTGWGAAPFRNRIPDRDAEVVRLLDEACGILVAKLSLGALAYGDIWYGGTTKNPWKTDQGSSGSSAGSAAAVAAGLVPYALGTETLGSIVSPSLRCGVTGLRPTFGRISRYGAMALSWSFDKVGILCRFARDAAQVLEVLSSYDPRDPHSVDTRFTYNVNRSIKGTRIGIVPKWFENDESDSLFEKAFNGIEQTCRETGMQLVEPEIPDLPYHVIIDIIRTEAAACFEHLTLNDTDDELTRQDAEGWPNIFRAARFIPAVEYVQARRLVRLIKDHIARLYQQVDILINPEHAGPLLLIGNATGRPSLTIPAGYREDGTPFGVNIVGDLFEEELICRVGEELEGRFNVSKRPSLHTMGS